MSPPGSRSPRAPLPAMAMPSPDFSRQRLGPGHDAAGGVEVVPDRVAARRRPGASRSSTAEPAAHQRLVVEVARAEPRRPRAARTGRPSTASCRAPCESSTMPPAAKPPVASTTASAGSARVRGAVVHPHAAHPAARALASRWPTGPAPGRPPAARSAAVERALQPHAGHRRREVGISTTGAPSSSASSLQASPVAPCRAPRAARRLAGLDQRPQLVGEPAPVARVVERAGVDRGRRRRPSRAGPTQSISRARALTARRRAARRGQVLGQQRRDRSP